MRFRRTLYAGAMLMFAAMPLRAEQTETPAPIHHASNESDTRIVCHRETVTGSHLPRTVCTSKRERDQRRAQDRHDLEEVQRASARERN